MSPAGQLEMTLPGDLPGVSRVTVRLMSDGELAAAERQAHFRATHANRAPRIRYRSRRPPQPGAEMACRSGRAHRLTLNALPQNPEASATAEALSAICDLDLSYIEGVEPTRGFGRD